MKIERISDSQVKFVLNKTDLSQRDIKITELAYGSEKTQELFREMMEQAFSECGFEADNTPLMIEAIPVTVDSIMIIVTKVSGSDEVETKFNLLPRSKDYGKFKKKAMLDGKDTKSEKTSIYIYSFHHMDDAIHLSSRLTADFEGESGMYKYNNLYYLILENQTSYENSMEFEAILSEYGQKHVSGVITKYHLIEHGDMLIENNAVGILAAI